ncbi:MAG: hypothetical protein Q7T89_05490 [Anaerolineales bacterium]|nr:hypothetical protein [Anaerolineales bacterium]
MTIHCLKVKVWSKISNFQAILFLSAMVYAGKKNVQQSASPFV